VSHQTTWFYADQVITGQDHFTVFQQYFHSTFSYAAADKNSIMLTFPKNCYLSFTFHQAQT